LSVHRSPPTVISNEAGRLFLPLSLLRNRRPAQREILFLFDFKLAGLRIEDLFTIAANSAAVNLSSSFVSLPERTSAT